MSVHRILALAVSGVVLTTGALTAGAATGAATGAVPRGRAAGMVPVSIDRSGTVTLPSVVAPGVTTYKVTTTKRHAAFQVLSLAPGYTAEQAQADVENGLEKNRLGALRRFEANATLLGGVTATKDKAGKLVIDLDAGSYYALDTRRRSGPWTAFTVAGTDTGASLPDAATLKAVDSTRWAKKPASIPHAGWLHFKNRADQNHFVVLAKLKKGRTVDDFAAFIEDESGPPPVRFDQGLDSGALSPGHDMVMKYRLTKGDYVLMCFWPDAAMKGTPHVFMGMYRGVEVR